MKITTSGSSLVVSLLLVACSGGIDGAANDSEVEQSEAAIVRPTSDGGKDQVVLLYITTQGSTGLGTRVCSGTYFAPRVVLTAAHCLANVFQGQVLAYYGDDFATDSLALPPLGTVFVPPVPGTPSHWSKADSFETHPDWNPANFHPDMAVVYLDRKLPFDPLPIDRVRVDQRSNADARISGWGANLATGPTTATGSRVQRTGRTTILGSPTAADYHPEDPNPGMLVPAIRQNVLKTDGHAPNSNACFGDSGGPLLTKRLGTDHIVGVSYYTGLSCEDYGLYTRIDPFLPFLDRAEKKGGKEKLTPTFDCVAANPSGVLTAYFGYDNQNGVSVNIPFGAKNQLALDVHGFRPSKFLPGAQHFAVGVDFTSTQTVKYTLDSDGGPKLTLKVDRNSQRCGAAQAGQVECGGFCRGTLGSGCTGLPNFGDCMSQCLGTTEFVSEIAPECLPQNTALNQCLAGLPPGNAHWTCIDGFFPPAAPSCDGASAAFNGCLGF